MENPQAPQGNNLSVLSILVFVILIIQLGQIFQVPLLAPQKLDERQLKDAILEEVRQELPALVIDQIGTQIHELVMDKIKFNGAIQDGVEKAQSSEPIAMQVGSKKIHLDEFRELFGQFRARAEVKSLSPDQQKQRFLDHVQRHYAILEDCINSDIPALESYKSKVKGFRFKAFLHELVKTQIQPVNAQEIQNYYQTNLSLYEIGESFSFEAIESSNQEELLQINSIERFDSSQLEKIRVNQAPEEQVSFALRKTVRNLKVGELSPVLLMQGKYVLVKKTAPVQKLHQPIQQAARFIQQTLTFDRIRKLIAQKSNAIKFEFNIASAGDSYTINSKELDSELYKLSKEVIPAEFFSKLEQNKSDLKEFQLELNLLDLKYNINPLYFGVELKTAVNQKIQNFEEIALIQERENQLQEQVTVSESELKLFYESNKQMFAQAKGQLVSHIFAGDRSRALELLNRALMDPANFSQLAKENSQEQRTAPYGGDMRYLPGALVSENMRQAAASLKEGEVFSQLVSGVNGGYHILKYVREAPAKIADFEEVKNSLRDLVLKDKKARLIQGYMQDVTKKYPAKFDANVIAQL